MLLCLPKYKDSVVVRSRDPDVLKSCGTLVDVGAVYDHSRSMYDHHQREFASTNVFPGQKIKLSSAGLVYKHFGGEIIESLVGPLDKTTRELLVNKVYERVVKEVDAIDNGVSITDGDTKYKINTNLSSRVGRLNPDWNASSEESSDKARNGNFRLAMSMVFEELCDAVEWYAYSWLPARDIVLKAVREPVFTNNSKEALIIKIDRYCPWKSHLFDIETELKIQGKILYVLYPDSSGNWRVQAVPPEQSSFDCRKKLPEPWRGVRNDALDKLTGLPGCIFVHAAGFIGGAKSYDTAFQMAKMSVNFSSK